MSVYLDDLIGLPYSDDPRAGYNCWTLVQEVYRRFGRELPDYPVDVHDINAINETIAREIKTPKWKKLDQPEVPCIVAIRYIYAITHVGVYIGFGRFLHVDKFGVRMGHVSDPIWSKRISGYWQYVGGE